MNAFEEASGVENEALRVLIPYCKQFCDQGTQIISTSGQLFAQKYTGDLLVRRNGSTTSIELKSESDNKYGNLFLESWSNKHLWTIGWLYTTRADLLWYYFVGSDELYSIQVEPLRRWCFGFNGEGNVYRYDEKPQSKRGQRNDTWGWCVPIADLRGVDTFKGPINAYDESRLEASS